MISYFLNPLFLIFLLLIVSIIYKKKKINKALLIISLVAFYIFSNKFAYVQISKIIEYKPINSNQIKTPYNYGIVLGGYSAFDTINNKVVFSQAGDRIMQTVDLYFNGKIKKIIISGGSIKPVSKNQIESEYTNQILLKWGIPQEDIIVENKSRNTYENAKFTSEILKNKTGKYLLISSSIHAYRAKLCFEKAGIKTDIYPTDYMVKYKYSFADIFIPDSSIFNEWSKFFHEIFGIISYKILGNI